MNSRRENSKVCTLTSRLIDMVIRLSEDEKRRLLAHLEQNKTLDQVAVEQQPHDTAADLDKKDYVYWDLFSGVFNTSESN